MLGADRLIQMIEMMEKYFDCENLAELSFEFNPYPEQEIYEIIRKIQSRYAKNTQGLGFHLVFRVSIMRCCNFLVDIVFFLD